MTINDEEYQKIKHSAVLCSVRSQYIHTLSNINQMLNTVFFTDKEFLEYYRNLHMHAAEGIIVGLLLSLLAFPLSILIIFLLFSYDENLAIFLIGLSSILVLCAGGVGGYFYSFSSTNQKAEKELRNYAQIRTQSYEARPDLIKAQAEYQQKLSDLVNQMYDRNVCIIPSNYWDYAPILVSYIDNCRAHDLESAINVLEQDLHNQRMEQTQLMSYMEQLQTRLLNEQIAVDTAAAREAAEQAQINSRTAAIFSELAWYNTL